MGLIPFVGAVEGIPDVDTIVKGMVGVVGDESWARDRRLILFVGLFIVDFQVLIVVIHWHGQHAVC